MWDTFGPFSPQNVSYFWHFVQLKARAEPVYSWDSLDY